MKYKRFALSLVVFLLIMLPIRADEPENVMKSINAGDIFEFNKNISAGKISHVGSNSDYAPFLEKGIPAYSTWVRGGQRYGVHTKEDSIYVITPKIMEDIVRLYFMAGYKFANK